LRLETRKAGQTWILRYQATRPSDGKRVENTEVIGLLSDFPTQAAAWAEVDRRNPEVSKPALPHNLTFADLCAHYFETEVIASGKLYAKETTTVEEYKRIFVGRLIPRFGKQKALEILPVEIEGWLDDLQQKERLEKPILDEFRHQMSLAYRHGQRSGLLPRTQEANPLTFVRRRLGGRSTRD